MTEPKELWIFDTKVPRIMGPLEITGETAGNHWYYKYDNNIYICRKDKIALTRKEAVGACYNYHGKIIKQEQNALNEKKQLLREFCEEVLFG